MYSNNGLNMCSSFSPDIFLNYYDAKFDYIEEASQSVYTHKYKHMKTFSSVRCSMSVSRLVGRFALSVCVCCGLQVLCASLWSIALRVGNSHHLHLDIHILDVNDSPSHDGICHRPNSSVLFSYSFSWCCMS